MPHQSVGASPSNLNGRVTSTAPAGRGLCCFSSGTSAHEEPDVELWVHLPFGIGGLVPELDVPELPEEFEMLDGVELLSDVPDEVDETGVLDVVLLVVVPESA